MENNILILFKNAFLHTKRILIHKFWVCHYCFKCGLYWQGLTHDLSKFSPTEFLESIQYYKDGISPIVVSKKENGISYGWLHHKGRNPHHYEYWTDNYDAGIMFQPIPKKYAYEMICDYLGAARTYGDFSYMKEYEWWENRKASSNISMHWRTKLFITIAFILLLDPYSQRHFKYCLDLAWKYSLEDIASININFLNKALNGKKI